MNINDIKSPALRKQIESQLHCKPLFARDTGAIHAQAGMVQAMAQEVLTERSPLEVLFLQRWTEANGPFLEEEVELVPEKKYRCDFLHAASETVFEVQGYTDHASRKGFERDAVKFLELYLLGYTVVILTRKTITVDNITRIVARLKRKS